MTIYYKEILDAGYYTYHFGVKMKFSSSLKINRENYAAIDKKNSFWSRKNYERNPEYYRRNYELFSGKYADETCSQYSDKWCREHREACLNNFDYNMEFFKKINKAHFENVLNGLLTYSEHIKEISELSECKDVSGIYIMVLDEYKQMYIGQSNNIYRRIRQHWSTKKEFDRLIFGKENNSVLSIDSFGPLDTTRIFIFPVERLDEIEGKLVNAVPDIYRLNRIGGGKIDNMLYVLETWNTRDFSECQFGQIIHKLETTKKEKYYKEFEQIKFIKSEMVQMETLSVGDIICIKVKNSYSGKEEEWVGKLSSMTACYISVICYGKSCNKVISKNCINRCEKKPEKYAKRWTKKNIKEIWYVDMESKFVKRAYWRTVSIE